MRFDLPLMILLALTTTAVAQEQRAPSLLEQLDREVRQLHESVQASIVRVQLPPPKWVADMLADDHPAAKWKDLDPKVKSQLEAQQRRAAEGQYDNVGAVIIPPPATQPGDAPATQPSDGAWQITRGADGSVSAESSIDKGDGRMLIVTQRQGDAGLRIEARASGAFMPNNIAIVLDDQGHLLVPIYLERDQFSGPVHVSVSGERITTASFIASDRQTGLTVLKAQRPIGKAARMSAEARPAQGGLVLLLSPNGESARLSVWTGGAGEWGVVVAMDGTVAGFARHGQFLGGGLTTPVVKQLIEKGSVQRPTLGLMIAEVRGGDALRQQVPSLGSRPALLVRQVLPDSAAGRAGVLAGDLIVALDGHEVGDIPTFAATVAQCGAEAKLTVLREGVEHELVVHFSPKE